MENVLLEKQGRILLPKEVRRRLGLRAGERLAMQIENQKIILKPQLSKEDFISELEGCVKESKINPLELKKIWGM